MLFQTPSEFAALALCLVAGWLLGLASAPGGRKWKLKYRALDEAHRRFRDEAERAAREKDAHIHQIETDRDRRIAELEAARTPPVAAAVAPVAATAAMRGAPGRDAGGSWRDWFGRARDNLSRINGIDEAMERQLNALGLKSFRDVETLTDDDAAALEDELAIARGTIGKQEWRGQARALREGVDEMDRRRV